MASDVAPIVAAKIPAITHHRANRAQRGQLTATGWLTQAIDGRDEAVIEDAYPAGNTEPRVFGRKPFCTIEMAQAAVN